MKINKILFLCFIFVNQFIFSQSGKIIHGEISCESNPVQGIEIINLVSEKSAFSDQNGMFSISVNPEDMLVFCSDRYDYKRKFIEQEDINENCLIIKLTKKAIQLDAVVVYNYSKINAVSLGIVSANVKSYSPAERRLLTSNSSNLKGNTDGTTGGSFSADPLFNMFSGRTKSLRIQLEIEHKEKLLDRLNAMFMNSFYEDKLKINKDYIKAFQFYIVEDKDFVNYVNANDKTAYNFRIIQLAEDFNKLQSNEK